MRPITQSITGAGSTAGIVLDNYISPFNVGFGVVVSGTVNYKVEHTFDGDTWFTHPDVTGLTANQDGNYAFPVQQIRLTISSGTGTASITAIQAGVAS